MMDGRKREFVAPASAPSAASRSPRERRSPGRVEPPFQPTKDRRGTGYGVRGTVERRGGSKADVRHSGSWIGRSPDDGPSLAYSVVPSLASSNDVVDGGEARGALRALRALRARPIEDLPVTRAPRCDGLDPVRRTYVREYV